ncbi:hypothetical protein GEV33_000766 [Tenebrio molitor]|uniref:Uncharacterized protein n=1 Tax=Tenebrio molitor TaxID=7067 RepID=A0A8J6HNL9_TENMO|nr:hypothetical protein GEV33_000766 [Tenebrio molitor]
MCKFHDEIPVWKIFTVIFHICLYTGVTKKTHRERKLKDSVGDRRAGGCAASRELRITCVAFGIRNHPRERIADRHGAYRPALPAFGAVEEPENLPYRYCLPWSRNPSSSSEIEEYRKVLLQFIAEQPLSAERMVIARPVIVLLGYRFEAGRSPHRCIGSSQDQLSFSIVSFPAKQFSKTSRSRRDAFI